MQAPQALQNTFTNTPIGKMTKSWAMPIKRAVATFIFAATGALASASLTGVNTLQAALMAGTSAVINFVYRLSESWLKQNPE